MDPEVTRLFEVLCKTVLLNVVVVDAKAGGFVSDAMRFYNQIIALLMERIQSDLSKLHIINETGFPALMQAHERHRIFNGQRNPHMYVNILTWALRDESLDYMDLMPYWIKQKVTGNNQRALIKQYKPVLEFNASVEMFIVDKIASIAPNQYWVNQYILDWIDARVQTLTSRFDVNEIYEDMKNNLIPILKGKRFTHISDIVFAVGLYLSHRYSRFSQLSRQ